jgi:hypothetical protein
MPRSEWFRFPQVKPITGPPWASRQRTKTFLRPVPGSWNTILVAWNIHEYMRMPNLFLAS